MEKEEPIQEDPVNIMNNVASLISKALNNSSPGKFGFALLVFEFGTTEGRMNYISTAKREDMITAMKEFISRNEA